MGLFSGKKIISVASTVYNMAGEEKDRPQFLDSLVVRNVLSGTTDSMATTIMNGYLNGPSTRISQFLSWAEKPGNYDGVGLPTGAVISGSAMNPDAIEPYIPHGAGQEPWVQNALVGVADISYWAEQYVMINNPSQLDTAWVFDYNTSTNKVTIRYAGGSTVVFTPANFSTGANYLYAYYVLVTGSGTASLAYSTDNLFIYKIGSGNSVLDALAVPGDDYGGFYPFIPVRIDNQFLSTSFHPDIYEEAKDAYKKATGASFDNIVEDLKDNDQLGDIDNCYVVFGVSLNVVEMACKRYLYAFFQKLQNSQMGGAVAYGTFKQVASVQQQTYNTWTTWKGGHDNGTADATQEPPRPQMAQLAKNEIRIKSTSAFDAQYDIRIQWSFIESGQGSGLGRPGARVNDCWLEYIGQDSTPRDYYSTTTSSGISNDASYSRIRITWQRSATLYTFLDIVGLQHKNFVYGGKSVDITAQEALFDSEESGFIIPIHDATWSQVSILDTSQMGTACVFMVFNSYEVKKLKWYQTGIFRIFLVIIIAIVSVVFTGGAGIGLLGAHLTVGAALGFSGMTAAIVGSVVNALAALILTTILEKVASALGVIGPIIAAFLGFFVGNIISGFAATGSLAINWGSFLKVDNLLALTNAVGKGVAGTLNAMTVKIGEESERVGEEGKAAQEEIEQAYLDTFGYRDVLLDPMAMTNATQDPGLQVAMAETPSTFLTRTLLVGSDIVEMSHDLLYEFPKYTLKLPEAFV